MQIHHYTELQFVILIIYIGTKKFPRLINNLNRFNLTEQVRVNKYNEINRVQCI